MMSASLWLNILVLIPVCLGLLLDRSQMQPVFGPRTTAREILLCIYLCILAGSIWLLIQLFGENVESATYQSLTTLLIGQIVYKLLSVILVRDKTTPVIWFNLGIALFHATTLWMN
ncbi:MAG TPA: hypothetical protein PLZ57_15590 [Pseudobdellovibrionaceae bacterium]|nr:hypothetical protein [Pseudobdellovibrionaceae bacterium]